ncbi:unnamed protein product, partial [Thlaspi arvense]
FLSHITNTQSQDELNFQETGLSEEVNWLMKEKVALVKLLEEREYPFIQIEESTRRLTQIVIAKLESCSNQFTILGYSGCYIKTILEINLARNKVKTFHHEVTCKNVLLKAKNYKQEMKRQPKNVLTTENVLKMVVQELKKPSVRNRRQYIKSKCAYLIIFLLPSGAHITQKIESEKREIGN